MDLSFFSKPNLISSFWSIWTKSTTLSRLIASIVRIPKIFCSSFQDASVNIAIEDASLFLSNDAVAPVDSSLCVADIDYFDVLISLSEPEKEGVNLRENQERGINCTFIFHIVCTFFQPNSSPLSSYCIHLSKYLESSLDSVVVESTTCKVQSFLQIFLS